MMETAIPLSEAMFCWGRAGVLVVRHPDTGNFSHDYDFTDGACWTEWRKMTPAMRELATFKLFHRLVVAENIPVEAVVASFSKIAEYRRLLVQELG